jgi:nucleotide-binding universal stress UspA family protein
MNMRNVILVGVDGSSNSNIALEWAIVEANIRNWPLRLVSTFPPTFVADPIVGASYALAARQEAQAVLDHATKTQRLKVSAPKRMLNAAMPPKFQSNIPKPPNWP